MTSSAAPSALSRAPRTRRRTLVLSGLAHALHDGYTDAIYVLLPVWRAEFGLDYVALALLRGLYAGAMAILQVPASWLADHVGGRAVLILGTVLAAAGYALAGFSGGAMGLYAALLVSGAGSSVQHPIASSAVSRAYGAAACGPLGTYNFSGDLGKAIIPAALSFGLSVAPWRPSLWLLALAGIAVAALLTLLMPRIEAAPPPAASGRATLQRDGTGFPLLLAIGVIDTGVRMGFLTFLPFLLQLKGASQPLIGAALAFVFLGGAAGKLACGWLAQRWGVVAVTLCTEGLTALMIALAALLPLVPLLILLPLLGLTLNGTSSVLYGTVPELAPADRTERAFAIFYTGVIGSGALSPLLFGAVGDQAGPVVATLGTAAAALVNLPLALALGPRLARR
ncbi:MFS transporter [Starkeya sp. 3C]|uniref:MFS transporter n=1 Tax=Ancylobacter moscoviensis TaxID=2597768 RepID=A0ABY3DM24_9HYPH|nr:MFS transporter [Ancylobacter moscoviensis]TSJ60320.1 MFS transporter [Ancylobacter moscoviensis]